MSWQSQKTSCKACPSHSPSLRAWGVQRGSPLVLTLPRPPGIVEGSALSPAITTASQHMEAPVLGASTGLANKENGISRKSSSPSKNEGGGGGGSKEDLPPQEKYGWGHRPRARPCCPHGPSLAAEDSFTRVGAQLSPNTQPRGSECPQLCNPRLAKEKHHSGKH